jgi:hypothetical protein
MAMRVALPDWTALALFAAMILALAVYGLAVSAHFPREHRRESLRSSAGAAVLWGTMAVAAIAAVAALHYAVISLPGYSAVIAGGAALLAAPLVLKPLPDSLVDGRAGLLVFAALAAALALISARL